MLPEPTVFLVDDDTSVLNSLRWLIQSVKLRVETYASAEQFLKAFDPKRPGCLVLDIRMPHMSGLELQVKLASIASRLPIIIMTGHGDVAMCAKVFRSGGFDFLEKPADDKLLLDRIRAAIEHDSQTRVQFAKHNEVTTRLEKLSSREREVMELLIEGASVKQIASQFAISAQTAAKHRSSVHVKMRVETDTELANLIREAISNQP